MFWASTRCNASNVLFQQTFSPSIRHVFVSSIQRLITGTNPTFLIDTDNLPALEVVRICNPYNPLFYRLPVDEDLNRPLETSDKVIIDLVREDLTREPTKRHSFGYAIKQHCDKVPRSYKMVCSYEISLYNLRQNSTSSISPKQS